MRTSSDEADLRNWTPLERVTGDTVDISEYLDFGFYDWCWYHEIAGLGPTKLGRWLGVVLKNLNFQLCSTSLVLSSSLR